MADHEKKIQWRVWLVPLLTAICFYVLIRLLFSGAPFFVRVIDPGAIPGEVPQASYRVGWRLVGLILTLTALLGLAFQMMRHWARYYLNRKILISYLFFALVPLITTVLIFFGIVRAWFGITNTMAFDKALDQHAEELQNFVLGLQEGLRRSNLETDLDTRIKRLIDDGIENELSTFSRHQRRGIDVAIYLQPAKVPGTRGYLIRMYETGEDAQGFMEEETREYERVIPSWMVAENWSGVVMDDGQPILRHFNREEHEDGIHVVILASERLDNTYLERFRELQAVRVTFQGDDGRFFYATEDPAEKWYLNLLLKPFGTTWDHLAVDWESGFYQPYGYVRFDLPAELGSLLETSGRLPFFYRDQKNAMLRFILGIILIVFLCELVAFVFGGFLVGYITRSLNAIAEGHEKVAAGQLSYRLPYIGQDQLGNMGRSFNMMLTNIESLMTQVTEQEKYYEELRIAREIQMSLLPDLETLDWCSNIAANCIPARDVGGDYYEVVQAGTGEIGIFIADVSGKGTSAAFYMAELKGVLIALRHLWSEPRELMMHLNEILRPALQANVFISAAYLLLNPHTDEGQLARAGHCPAYHVKPDGTVVELMPPGMAIGIAGNDVFGRIMETETFDMAPDDKVVLYTDGLDEMTNQNQMYGQARLRSILARNAELEVDALRRAILEDVLDFLSSDVQDDDLTLVVAGLPSRAQYREMVASREKGRRA